MSNEINPSRPPQGTEPIKPSFQPAEAVRAKTAEVATPKPLHDPQETRRELEAAMEHLNKQMARNGRDLSFRVDDVAKMVVITVKNRDGEVVRQIPNEVVLRIAHNLENVKGLMQDENS